MSSVQRVLDHINSNPKFVNTRYFREAAIDYKKNGKRYTLAPKGTREWYDFWELHRDRCLNGYTVGGVTITGRHYFYMNFTQLRKVDDDLKGDKVASKDWDFPLFYEIDYDWFWYKEIAWYGCTPEELAKLHLWRNPTRLEGGLHLGCLKTRRAGFSYKEAADGVYNYLFIAGSKSFYLAFDEGYLNDDGILNKVAFDLEFLNQQTDGYFLRNRMQSGTVMKQLATYKDKQGNIKGTGSLIEGHVIKKADGVRGKEGNKMVFEEAGSFPGLPRAIRILMPSVKEGITLTGQISVFGTGGEEKGKYVAGLQEVFEKPKLYDMLPFTNDWVEGAQASECGVFIPCYMANPTFMDLDGNCLKSNAINYEEGIRQGFRDIQAQSALDQHSAENPMTPQEALLRPTNNDFPLQAILAQKNFAANNPKRRGALTYGNLVRKPTEGGGTKLVFEVVEKTKAKVIDYFPLEDQTDVNTTTITVKHFPESVLTQERTPDGRMIERNKIPDDVYKIYADFYIKDKDPKTAAETTTNKTSLGSFVIYRVRSNYFGNTTEEEVGWFAGRPNRVDDYYQLLIDAADYWNADIQGEIAGGGQGLVTHARTKKSLHRVAFTPINNTNKENKVEEKNRSYLMDIGDEEKRLGIIYLASWLQKIVGIDKDGNPIWNLHLIDDIGFLDECLNFNDTGNFDRISARITAQHDFKQGIEERIQKAKKKTGNKFGNKVLFQNGTNNNFNKPFIMQSDII